MSSTAQKYLKKRLQGTSVKNLANKLKAEREKRDEARRLLKLYYNHVPNTSKNQYGQNLAYLMLHLYKNFPGEKSKMNRFAKTHIIVPSIYVKNIIKTLNLK